MKRTCACVVTHEMPARQIRVTDGKAAPLLRCSRADVSAMDFRRRTASRRCCTKEAKKNRKKIERMREIEMDKEREKRERWESTRMDEWIKHRVERQQQGCLGTRERRRDWIKTQNRVVFSSSALVQIYFANFPYFRLAAIRFVRARLWQEEWRLYFLSVVHEERQTLIPTM